MLLFSFMLCALLVVTCLYSFHGDEDVIYVFVAVGVSVNVIVAAIDAVLVTIVVVCNLCIVKYTF